MSDSDEMTDADERGREYDPDADHAFPDERANEVLSFVREDPEIQTYLRAQNVNPVLRKGYNDHGSKHI